MNAIFGFEDLVLYQKARAFRKRVYKLARLLPAEERFALSQQMRRAAVSVTNNIAEGYGRFSYKDRIHFLVQSRGSIMELADDLNVCEDAGYAKAIHLANLRSDAGEVTKLINGFINYLKYEAKTKRPTPQTPPS